MDPSGLQIHVAGLLPTASLYFHSSLVLKKQPVYAVR